MHAPSPRFLQSLLTLATALGLGVTPARTDEPRPRGLAGFDATIKPEHRRHWAFQPVRRPPVPTVRNKAWVRNPIDAFVMAGLEARDWRTSPPAEPRALLR